MPGLSVKQLPFGIASSSLAALTVVWINGESWKTQPPQKRSPVRGVRVQIPLDPLECRFSSFWQGLMGADILSF